ncbi:MAG: RNA-binding transcriptional accessory protein, partial [Methanomicrobiales archaeon]|nr:RNA-binding transcriptional accessory protein [Methanomicrobiales archaeon]
MYSKIISSEFNIPLKQVTNTLLLFDEGSTIPFISRYRKEMTGGLDEVIIGDIKNRYQQLQDINSRRETILTTIEKLGELTDELREKIENSWDANELEDLYLPYKPKRKTRAVVAREKGLEPLAEIIFKQDNKQLEDIVFPYLNDEVPDIDTALQGARDIIAEWISEDLKARNVIRQLFEHDAVISSRVVKSKEAEAIKYLDYFEYNEPLRKCRSHRLLAIRRGEKEGFLKVSIAPDNEIALQRLIPLFVKGRNSLSDEVKYALEDSYKRLLAPSIENEVAAASRTIAEMEAIKVFATNLRQLLLAPPLGQKRVMAIDPGFRTGCKVVCLDAQGQLLHNETIYPHPPQKDLKQAVRKIETLVEAYKTEVIAIGNGTASRETEAFIRKIHFKQNIQVFVVSEDGASVYSASKTAREEFPDFDVTVRGAVSIGRRLMDPLAELVKIDPKSIGVGQY